MPTPDRRPRGQNRRARQGHRAPTEGSLLQRIQTMAQKWREQRQAPTPKAVSKESAPDTRPASRFAFAARWRLLPRTHTIALLILIPVWLGVLAWQPAAVDATAAQAPSGTLAVPIAVPVEAQQTPAGQTVQAKPKPVEQLPAGWRWLNHDISAGETLFTVFRNFKLPGAEMSRLVAIEGPDRPLTRLPAGKSVNILLDNQGRIQRVEIRDHDEATYRYERDKEGFVQKEIRNR